MQKATSKALFNYWNELRGSRSAPDRRDIDPTRIKTALANTFILERDEKEGFSFRLAGSHLCMTYCRELKGRSFSSLWHDKDRDAMDTLIHAVTEDHAVALVTFNGMTATGSQATFELILMPLRHNGETGSRILGAMSVIEEPFWLGAQPIMEQRITGLRLIWPDDPNMRDDIQNLAEEMTEELAAVGGERNQLTEPMPATVFGNSARRYQHLAVIDGGRS